MIKKISVILIVCLFLYITALAFHRHEDNAAHNECRLCLGLLVHSSVILPSVSQVSAPVISIEPIFQERAGSFLNSCPAPHGDRAPPLP